MASAVSDPSRGTTMRGSIALSSPNGSTARSDSYTNTYDKRRRRSLTPPAEAVDAVGRPVASGLEGEPGFPPAGGADGRKERSGADRAEAPAAAGKGRAPGLRRPSRRPAFRAAPGFASVARRGVALLVIGADD